MIRYCLRFIGLILSQLRLLRYARRVDISFPAGFEGFDDDSGLSEYLMKMPYVEVSVKRKETMKSLIGAFDEHTLRLLS